MNRHHQLLGLAIALAAVGISLFVYKTAVRDFPLTPGQEAQSWMVEIKINFLGGDDATKVELLLPDDTGELLLSDESFAASGYGLNVVQDDGPRRAVWSKRNTEGEQTIFYRTRVTRYPGLTSSRTARPTVQNNQMLGTERQAAQALLRSLRNQSADVETLVLELLDHLRTRTTDDNVAALLGGAPTLEGRVEAAVGVLAEARIPARAVHGLKLAVAGRNQSIHHWLEVYYNRSWQPFDVETGQPGVPEHYLPWWRSDKPLVKVNGAVGLETVVSAAESPRDALRAAMQRAQAEQPWVMAISLANLPLESQLVYRIMMLIPIGAVVLVLMRQFVGVPTFGTFMPVLIALAFRETQLLTGIALFSVIVMLGLAVRSYLERLQLLLVPRLAAMLVVVILLMAAFSIVTTRLGISSGLSIALFPLVILTMTIERMSVVWEEYGAADALKQGIGSLGVAVLAYLAMTNELTSYLTFIFPELLLPLLAAMLLFGRYTGYRVTELVRFRDLAREGI
jgi:hypothetical protein